jgi:predicted acetyltransferase
MKAMEVTLLDCWRVPEARTFFENVWPLYVHELTGFDTDFYRLGADGKWVPDLVEGWTAPLTPSANLRHPPVDLAAGPFQRAHVIVANAQPVGFVCVTLPPCKYMPPEADVQVAELFIANPFRARGVAREAVQHLLRRYRGRWHLSAIHDNHRALGFWRKVLPTLPIANLREMAEEREVTFSFVT